VGAPCGKTCFDAAFGGARCFLRERRHVPRSQAWGGNDIISIIIPAHNEANVIGRSLAALTEGARPGELDVIVICNGCRDATADLARSFGAPVRVIETDKPSKANALNMGDRAATSFPRLYLDADVVMTLESVRRLAAALEEGRALAAAPRVETRFPPDASWPVRAYYNFWMALPYVREGMIAAGAYAVSRSGRERFGDFPDVISDDGYFRLQYQPGERLEVEDAVSRVWAPSNLRDLIRIRTRSRIGARQVRELYPHLFLREAKTKNYVSAFLSIATKPNLYFCALPYVVVTCTSRLKARRMARHLKDYVWERDDSSRRVLA
jgi:glycosyltransferase involved in cell wall biosynthesis